MSTPDIGSAYNSIVQFWESEQFDRSNGIAQHERAIAFVQDRGKALDVGCGCTGRFIDLLRENGFAPEGIDVSAEMIASAQRQQPDICFHHADIRNWEIPDRYDLITAWDSIWHLPAREQRAVITKLVQALNSGGVLILSCGGTDRESEHLDDAMGPTLLYGSLGVEGYLTLIAELDCVCRHFEYDQHPELHAYLIAQKR